MEIRNCWKEQGQPVFTLAAKYSSSSRIRNSSEDGAALRTEKVLVGLCNGSFTGTS